jgi:hypothetical protein
MADDLHNNDLEILHHRIDEVPEHARYHAKKGFESLGTVTAAQFERFTAEYFGAVEKGELLESDKVAATLELDQRFLPDALFATSLTMGALADLSATAEDLLNIGEGKIFESRDAPVVRSLADQVIARRDSIQSGMRRSSIAASVITSFQSIVFEVDLRIRFDEENAVKDGAPVAIVSIRTDAEDDFIFQMDVDDVRRVIKRLEDVEKKLKIGGALVAELSKA